MRGRMVLRRWISGLLALAVFAAAAVVPVAAEEEASRFLEALRSLGYYDLALDYVQQMRTSPLCPKAFKETIDYEAGRLLIRNAVTAGTLREQRLEEAQQAFDAFIKAHPSHPLSADAALQLANVLVEKGKLRAELAAQPGKKAAEKTKLLGEARALYQEALKAFERAEKRAYELAKRLEQEAKQDPRKESDRDDARRELLRARLSVAGVIYDIGKTYPSKSKEYKDRLADAGKRYGELFEKYQDYAAGLYAGMRQGVVFRDLGQTDKAVERFKRICALLQGTEGDARTLANQALAELVETYVDPKLKRKKHLDALAAVDAWMEQARPGEESSEEGLRIRLLAGRAALELAESLPEKEQKRRRQLAATARKHLEFVARFYGPLQREARTLLTHDLIGQQAETGEEPTNYEEAKQRADFAWATLVINQGKLAQATDPKQRKELEAETNTLRDDAFRFYRLALRLQTPRVSIDEVNLIRLRLAYLHWLRREYLDAAILGEFLAKNYPQAVGTKQAAEIAVKAYRVLYQLSQDPKPERQFEVQHMRQMADLICRIWPDQPEADEARMMLLDTAVDNRDLAEADRILSQIPEDSPRRGEAELRVGQALWALYVTESAKEGDERPPQEQLDQLVQKAQQTLEQGIARMRKAVDQGGKPDYTLAYSVLSLANILLGAGQSEEAARWLDDPKIGPVPLVEAKDPVTDRGNFRVETYKAALRAYVGAQQLEKAEKAMKSLEELVAESGDAEAARRLTQIYIVLGRELQDTLKRLRQENKAEEAEKVAAGFELFLSRIKDRQEGNTFSSLNWVAETFYNLGASMDPGTGPMPDKARQYYNSAAETYLQILKRIKADESGTFAPAGAALAAQVRLAACLRSVGLYDKAMKLLLALLKQKETRVNVQIEAARTYQEWADRGEKPAYFERAIAGGRKGDERLVWGWIGIARRVAPYPKFQDTFHEAWYNVAFCRMKLALTQKGAQRSETLKKAEMDILRVHQLYPEMGGEEMFAKYDALLKKIQKFRGVTQPAGLGQFDKARSRSAPRGRSAATASR